MEGKQGNKSEMKRSYSDMTSVNRVYYAREAILHRGGITDDDVAYIEYLITQGIRSNEEINRAFDSAIQHEPRKDSVNRARALKRAIEGIRHTIKIVAEAAKKSRDEPGLNKK